MRAVLVLAVLLLLVPSAEGGHLAATTCDPTTSVCLRNDAAGPDTCRVEGDEGSGRTVAEAGAAGSSAGAGGWTSCAARGGHSTRTNTLGGGAATRVAAAEVRWSDTRGYEAISEHATRYFYVMGSTTATGSFSFTWWAAEGYCGSVVEARPAIGPHLGQGLGCSAGAPPASPPVAWGRALP